jgi:putative hydrolase of the HAD superfamily
VDAVLLDAHGTLVALEPPVPLLRAALRAAGHDHDEQRVAAALRAEILHYRAHLNRGRDPASLALLRRECAGVLRDALGGDAPPLDALTPMLVGSLRFTLQPDALPALDTLEAAGVALGVVSNWDHALDEVLAGLGIRDRFGVVSASAAVGAAKPDPAIFHHALERLGVAPARALHCGDRPAEDCAGAAGAGVRAVLIDRAGTLPEGPCPRIRSLTAIAEYCKR